MTHGWRSDDWRNDDDLERWLAQDRESWRGDVHRDEPWRVDSGDDAWRGGEHFADWPEASAGPEYWMFKRAADGE
ncbi:MAG: hypothetical protein E6K55_11990 [Gemmatimonadetes bacterium]|nr:MAG: hypothetical protein DMD67_13535 [Gemmatimonadota bacterium]PYO99877.1 MAG: hypothetical protein DMD61_05980 [Gemmatimonadota bacterium]TLY50122.1 MAG: hypothetical protein E6K55_11990 [Gemmatimonadota bacterium]